MKKAMKIFGIIARTNKFVTILFVTALIGFSMAACGGDDGPTGGPDGGGGGQTGGGGSGNGWPPSNVRSSYGIGGMNQPPGSDFSWMILGAAPSGTFSSALVINWNKTSSTADFISSWFSSNGWSGDYFYENDFGRWQRGTQVGQYSGSGLIMYNDYR
jgi:hypothetical protein